MKLKVYTANYPYGYSESFLTNELEILKKEISPIEIIPYTQNGEIQKVFDRDLKITEFKASPDKLLIKDYFTAIYILLIEFFNTSKRGFFLKKIKRHFTLLKNAILLSKWIEKQGLEKKELHYSFWMNEWAFALSILKKKNKIDRFVFRVNGYDIWDERHEGNYLPFRYFIYSQTNTVFALSQTTVSYLQALKVFPKKIKLAYFGTKDLGIKDEKKETKFTVFSCSTAIPLKRLDKIARVLSFVQTPVLWIHHGEGETIDEVRKIVEKPDSNITFQQSKKKEDYMEVLALMKNTSPDLFINLSSTEGMPVTLIEALSFGIPLLANKVGSCHELFQLNIGILVEKDEAEISIAKKIDEFIENKDSILTAKEIKTYWNENFSAEKNYSKFAKELLQ